MRNKIWSIKASFPTGMNRAIPAPKLPMGSGPSHDCIAAHLLPLPSPPSFCASIDIVPESTPYKYPVQSLETSIHQRLCDLLDFSEGSLGN